MNELTKKKQALPELPTGYKVHKKCGGYFLYRSNCFIGKVRGEQDILPAIDRYKKTGKTESRRSEFQGYEIIKVTPKVYQIRRNDQYLSTKRSYGACVRFIEMLEEK